MPISQNIVFDVGLFNRNATIILIVIILGVGGLFAISSPIYGGVGIGLSLLILFVLKRTTKRFEFFENKVVILKGSRILLEVLYSEVEDFDLRYLDRNGRSPTFSLTIKLKNQTGRENEYSLPLAYSKVNKELDMDLLTFLSQKVVSTNQASLSIDWNLPYGTFGIC